MSNQKSALTIIIICVLCLLVGILTNITMSIKKDEANSNARPPKSKSAVFSYSSNKIAMITLSGAIDSDYEQSGYFGNKAYSAESVRRLLKKAYSDDSVKGVLLRINSPGGTVGMSQEIYSLIMKMRKKKPVVVSMGDVAASGGYYISSAADRIYAYPGTITGSIGVIFSSYDANELFTKKLGIKASPIKSGKYKDIGSMYRPMTKEERELLQRTINISYEQFLSDITKGRIYRQDKYKAPKRYLSSRDLRKYADGRIFTGEEARDLGFVDALGGLEDAHGAFKQILGKEYPLINYSKPSNFSSIFSSMSEAFMDKKTEVSYEQYLPFGVSHRNQILYMWE